MRRTFGLPVAVLLDVGGVQPPPGTAGRGADSAHRHRSRGPGPRSGGAGRPDGGPAHRGGPLLRPWRARAVARASRAGTRGVRQVARRPARRPDGARVDPRLRDALRSSRRPDRRPRDPGLAEGRRLHREAVGTGGHRPVARGRDVRPAAAGGRRRSNRRSNSISPQTSHDIPIPAQRARPQLRGVVPGPVARLPDRAAFSEAASTCRWSRACSGPRACRSTSLTCR